MCYWQPGLSDWALWWDKAHDRPHGDRLLYALSAVFGIGLLHHRSLLLFAPGLGLLVIYHLRADLWWQPRRTLICAGLVFVPALLTYPTVLPWLRSRELSPLLWQPTSMGDWIDFLLERLVLSGEALVFDAGIIEQLEIYIRTTFADYTPVVPIIGVLGFVSMFRHYLGAAIFLALSYGLEAVLSANFRGNEHQFTYYLPSFVTLLYACAYGFLTIWEWAKKRINSVGSIRESSLHSFAPIVGVIIILALPVAQFIQTYPDRREDAVYDQPLDLWRETLKTGDMGARLVAGMHSLPENATLAADWEQVTILWYYQQVEGIRPDLEIFYPVERYTDYLDERPVCLARHIPVDEMWHPTNIGALTCLQGEPNFTLPDEAQPVGTKLYTSDGTPALELAAFQANQSSYAAGTHAPLTIYWRALTDLNADYSISLQVLDENWDPVWSRDIQSPVMGMYPTSRWTEGEIVGDYHEIDITRTMPPGRYLWTVVVYRPLPDRNF